MRHALVTALLAGIAVPATAQQVPNAQADVAVSSRDRFYTSDQFSNTVSVIDPSVRTARRARLQVSANQFVRSSRNRRS